MAEPAVDDDRAPVTLYRVVSVDGVADDISSCEFQFDGDVDDDDQVIRRVVCEWPHATGMSVSTDPTRGGVVCGVEAADAARRDGCTVLPLEVYSSELRAWPADKWQVVPSPLAHDVGHALLCLVHAEAPVHDREPLRVCDDTGLVLGRLASDHYPDAATAASPAWRWHSRVYLVQRPGMAATMLPPPLPQFGPVKHWPNAVNKRDPRHLHTAFRALSALVSATHGETAVVAADIARSLHMYPTLADAYVIGVLTPYQRYVIRSALSSFRHDPHNGEEPHINDAAFATMPDDS